MEATADSSNPNTSWLNFRGTWITNVLIVIVLKLLFSTIPGVSAETSWTLTILTHNIVTFFFFHWLIGTPFDLNQGEYASLTMWEQIDAGAQFTPTRKFLTAFPIFLFLLSVHYTHYSTWTFCINFASLVLVLIGKLPLMDKVRIFGINKREE